MYGTLLARAFFLSERTMVKTGMCVAEQLFALRTMGCILLFFPAIETDIRGFCNGCCGGFGIPVAQKFGARDYSTMRSYVSVSLQLAVVMSVVIAIFTSIYCADILKMMRTPENIFEGAYAYLLVTFIGIPCTFFYNLLSSIIRALGDSKTPFYFLVLATVLNIILDL